MLCWIEYEEVLEALGKGDNMENKNQIERNYAVF